MDIAPGSIVRLKKQHPCGSDRWQVVRVGADIGSKRLTCQRQVLLPRSTFERRVKQIAPGGQPAEDGNTSTQ